MSARTAVPCHLKILSLEDVAFPGDPPPWAAVDRYSKDVSSTRFGSREVNPSTVTRPGREGLVAGIVRHAARRTAVRIDHPDVPKSVGTSGVERNEPSVRGPDW